MTMEGNEEGAEVSTSQVPHLGLRPGEALIAFLSFLLKDDRSSGEASSSSSWIRARESVELRTGRVLTELPSRGRADLASS